MVSRRDDSILMATHQPRPYHYPSQAWNSGTLITGRVLNHHPPERRGRCPMSGILFRKPPFTERTRPNRHQSAKWRTTIKDPMEDESDTAATRIRDSRVGPIAAMPAAGGSTIHGCHGNPRRPTRMARHESCRNMPQNPESRERHRKEDRPTHRHGNAGNVGVGCRDHTEGSNHSAPFGSPLS